MFFLRGLTTLLVITAFFLTVSAVHAERTTPLFGSDVPLEPLALPPSGPVPGALDAHHNYLVLDGEGNPAKGYEAELLRKYFGSYPPKAPLTIYKKVLPADGMLKVSRANARNPGQRTPEGHPIMDTDAMDVLQLRVRDHTIGQVEIIDLPRDEFGNTITTGTVKLALLPVTATLPAFSGRVLDGNGKPAAGIALGLGAVQMPGGIGGSGSPGTANQINVGPTGQFKFFVTTPSFIQQGNASPQPLPAGSTIELEIKQAGPEFMQSTYGVRAIEVAKPATIVMPQLAPLSFRVTDASGKSTVSEQPGDTFTFSYTSTTTHSGTISHLTTRIAAVDAETGVYKTEPVPVPGYYAPGMDFNSRKIMKEFTSATAASPIVWTLGAQLRHAASGRILDAVTGLPIQGAYVAASGSQGEAWKLARMTDEHRDTFWTMEVGKNQLSSEEMEIVSNAPHLDGKGSRTDEAGKYRIEALGSRMLTGMIFWAPGTIPVSVNLANIPDEFLEADEIPMPDVYLIPAAQVLVTVTSPGRIPTEDLAGEQKQNDVSFGTDVQFEIPKSWKAKHPLPSTDGDYMLDWRSRIFWDLGCADSWNRFGAEWPVFVPAEVDDICVKVSAPYANVVDDVQWFVTPALERGESRLLNPQMAGLKRPFTVLVLDGKGKPAVGMSVAVPGRPPVITNTEGKVIAWTSGHVDSVSVVHQDERRGTLATKKNFEIPESETMPVITLKLQP